MNTTYSRLNQIYSELNKTYSKLNQATINIFLCIWINIINFFTVLKNVVNYHMCKYSFDWCIYTSRSYFVYTTNTNDSVTIDSKQLVDYCHRIIQNIDNELINDLVPDEDYELINTMQNMDIKILNLAHYYMFNNASQNFPDIVIHNRYNQVLLEVICDKNRFVTSLPPVHYINYDKLMLNKIALDYLTEYDFVIKNE